MPIHKRGEGRKSIADQSKTRVPVEGPGDPRRYISKVEKCRGDEVALIWSRHTSMTPKPGSKQQHILGRDLYNQEKPNGV